MQNFIPISKSNRTLLHAYYFICSFGLLGFINHVAVWAAQIYFVPLNTFISYSPWAEFSGVPTKPSELLQYALSAIAMASYYSFVFVFIKFCAELPNVVLEKITQNRIVFIGFFVLLLTLNISLLQLPYQFRKEIFILWFVSLALPVVPAFNSWFDRLKKRSSLWFWAILATLIVSLGTVFYPYLTNGFLVSNDYMDIPEQTLLSTGVVDNTTYINAHHIGGLNKHDPRTTQGEILPLNQGENNHLGMTGKKRLGFIKMRNSNALSKFADQSTKYAYDEKAGVLFVNEHMTRGDAASLVNIAANETEKELIYDFYSSQKNEFFTKHSYSSEEIEFVRKNIRELKDQSLAGHYFHHLNTMLGTINEYSLGKPQSETIYLYGWLSTIAISKAMNAIGGISFESYLKAFYSFYPLYYLLVICAAAILFKKPQHVLFVALISISSLYLTSFESIRMAPGFNPIRHFFDVFALVCFYWYLFSTRRNTLYLGLSLVFTLLAILLNKEFGLVLMLSMLATIGIRLVVERRKFLPELIFVVIAVIAALSALLLIKTGQNPTLLYVLMGLAAPSIPTLKLYFVLILFSAIYVYLIKNLKAGNSWGYILLFWFFYTQGLLIYYIWNPALNHLYSLGAVWGMLIALLFRNWTADFVTGAKNEHTIIIVSNTLLAALIFLPSITSYYKEQGAYQKIFAEHKLYHWNFPRAHFSSTMDPSVFENAVQLINKYSSGNSIFIISKYDNILPFLSGKYSAMPFPQMDLSLVTKKEMDASVGLIQHDQPEYLFVDTDMGRSYVGDVYIEDDPVSKFGEFLYDASRGRAIVLEHFGHLFEGVKSMYEPIEVGQLITVYKRRSSTVMKAN